MIKLLPNSLIILDLDDTLYSERDFERSGFRAILDTLDVSHQVHIDELIELSLQGQDIFARLNFDENLRNVAMSIYRGHTPKISLYPDASMFIDQALANNCLLAIATEGRSVTQRNKIAALGLVDKVAHILISEEVGVRKIEPSFFSDLMPLSEEHPCVMIGDNPVKDFVVPNAQKWQTYMLIDRGNNVHSQDVDVAEDHRAQHVVHSFNEFAFST